MLILAALLPEKPGVPSRFVPGLSYLTQRILQSQLLRFVLIMFILFFVSFYSQMYKDDKLEDKYHT